jgi:putative membrane protein
MVAQTVCHSGYPGHYGFFWFPLVPLFFFGFWLVLFLVVRPLVWRRRGWAGYGPWSASGSAESVLAERFARGEVTEEEYRARLEVLRARR